MVIPNCKIAVNSSNRYELRKLADKHKINTLNNFEFSSKLFYLLINGQFINSIYPKYWDFKADETLRIVTLEELKCILEPNYVEIW
jgi:hypothetical protein